VDVGCDDAYTASACACHTASDGAEHRNADSGIAIERAYWDKGYGTDATHTMLRFAFTEMGLHRVTLGVADYNARARRVYEKCGFQVEGRLREAKFRDGRWCDNIIMGILDREFLALDQQAAAPSMIRAAKLSR
jgi:RimJ/RimL family protein N-acetyltransferase